MYKQRETCNNHLKHAYNWGGNIYGGVFNARTCERNNIVTYSQMVSSYTSNDTCYSLTCVMNYGNGECSYCPANGHKVVSPRYLLVCVQTIMGG